MMKVKLKRGKVTCPKSWNYQRGLRWRLWLPAWGSFHWSIFIQFYSLKSANLFGHPQIAFFFKLETVITDFLLEFFKLDFYYNILECKSGVSLHWPPELVLVIWQSRWGFCFLLCSTPCFSILNQTKMLTIP